MNKKLSILILFSLSLIVINGCKNSNQGRSNATILFILGTPSSGKTSIAKALQKQLDEPYLYAPTDTFVNMLPSSYIELEPNHKQGIYYIKDTSQSALRTYVKLGPIAQKLTTGIIRAIAGLASAGLNIICEGVVWEKEILQEAARGWKDFRVFFIHINPSLAVIEERENKRTDWFGGGERVKGHVLASYEIIQTFGDIYDLTLDTTDMTPAQSAQEIIAYMQKNPVPVAFKQLTRRK
jgi:chloramphenicol 3-O phosphotransferase